MGWGFNSRRPGPALCLHGNRGAQHSALSGPQFQLYQPQPAASLIPAPSPWKPSDKAPVADGHRAPSTTLPVVGGGLPSSDFLVRSRTWGRTSMGVGVSPFRNLHTRVTGQDWGVGSPQRPRVTVPPRMDKCEACCSRSHVQSPACWSWLGQPRAFAGGAPSTCCQPLSVLPGCSVAAPMGTGTQGLGSSSAASPVY